MYAEKRYSNGIVLRGVGETKEQSNIALREEKRRYHSAMQQGLAHLYFKPARDSEGRDKKIRSSGLFPYKKPNGRYELRMNQNHMVPVLTPKLSVFINTYGEKRDDS